MAEGQSPQTSPESSASGADATRRQTGTSTINDRNAEESVSFRSLFVASVLFVICTVIAVAYLYAPLGQDNKGTSLLRDADTQAQSLFVLLIMILTFRVHSLNDSSATSVSGRDYESWISTAYRLGRKHKIFLRLYFGLPMFIFLFAMIKYRHTDTAVFLMAIVAIYVAAQHYVALEKQNVTIEKTLSKINEQANEIETHTSELRGIRESFKEQITDLKLEVVSVKNALGTAYSQKTLYDQYRNPANSTPFNSGIYAVYHLLDIDQQWLRAPGNDRWETYCKPNAYPESLYAALLEGRRSRILIVTEMSSRLVHPDPSSETDGSRSTDFEKFVGLMWHTVVLRRVARVLAEAGIFTDYEIRVGYSSNWMHVIGGMVFQLFGEPPNNIYLRDLTLENYQRHDKLAGENLVKWAMEDVQRVASRGISSVDYLCAVMSHALLMRRRYKPEDQLSEGYLHDILKALGFEYWLKNQNESSLDDVDVKEAEELYAYLINSFLESISDDQPGRKEDFEAKSIYGNTL